MNQRIFIAEVNNQPSLCFDTGLDPRSFARTKMSQSLIDPGFTVNPGGSHEEWKVTGVNEHGGFMWVFGPHVPGKRLDLLLEEIGPISQSPALKQEALEAVIYWSKAKMFLGDVRSALNPGAAFVSSEGNVFLAPEHISTRCLFIEGNKLDTYNCPDLIGMDTTAFCTAVMLYKILTGNHPYPTADIYQDMREGVFLPIHIAAPGLNPQLAELIQAALSLPVEKKNTSKKSGIDILSGILEILTGRGNKFADVSSLFETISPDKAKRFEKEKKNYLFRMNTIIKTKRYILDNKPFLLGIALGVAFIFFILCNTIINTSNNPTTEGMMPDTVVAVYYEAFSSLNLSLMEACIKGADKKDINAVATFYAVLKQRQAIEGAKAPSIIQARVWKELGGQLPDPNVFGVTDLIVKHIGGEEEDGLIIYQADYDLWSPFDDFARKRSDILTLKRDRGKRWRIIELLRTEN
ncbi:MAG: hypothetical protein LBC76_02440 [Treponema sp.]|nr:hypothetical protein [Treponema sp.]